MLVDPNRLVYPFDIVNINSYGSVEAIRPNASSSGRATLVIGQVEGDASGSIVVPTNVDLILMGLLANYTNDSPVSSQELNANESAFSVAAVTTSTYYPNSLLLNNCSIIVQSGGSFTTAPAVII